MVRLIFTSFYTEFYADYVTLYDGFSLSAPLIASISGRDYSSSFHASSQRYMYIVFTSDSSSNSYSGFSATYYTSSSRKSSTFTLVSSWRLNNHVTKPSFKTDTPSLNNERHTHTHTHTHMRSLIFVQASLVNASLFFPEWPSLSLPNRARIP